LRFLTRDLTNDFIVLMNAAGNRHNTEGVRRGKRMLEEFLKEQAE
jgi:hypothetical protein